MRRILRIISITVIVLAVLVSGGILYTRFRAAQAEAEQSVVKVEDETVVAKGDLTVTVNATGSIAPLQQLPLAFDLSAHVKEILVKEGQLVKKGIFWHASMQLTLIMRWQTPNWLWLPNKCHMML